MNKKIKLFLLCGFTFIVGLLMSASWLFEHRAQAIISTIGKGYFTDVAYSGSGDPVLPKDYYNATMRTYIAISTDVYDKESFQQFLWNRNFPGSNIALRTSVAYIVCTMLGQKSGWECNANGYIGDWQGTGQDDRVITATGWSALRERLENPNLSINWNNGYTTEKMNHYVNTMYGPNQKDIYKYNQDTEKAYALIKFTVNDQLIYRLARDCGNPLGDLPGLPPPDTHPSNKITPYSSVNMTYAEPNDTVKFRHGGYNVSGEFTGRFTIARYHLLPDLPDNMPDISGNLVVTYYDSVKKSDDQFTPDNTELWKNDTEQWRDFVIPSDAAIGSLYCEKLYIYSTPGLNGEAGQACVRVVAKPYVKFYGADVDFCKRAEVRAWAKINRWEQDASGAWIDKGDRHVGSSSQFALYAYKWVGGFYTGETSTVYNPKQLTFANKDTPSGYETFGGKWSTANTTSCTDYFAAKPDGVPVQPSGYSIGGVTVGLGQNITTYVNGDAYIKGNIVYDTSGWNAGNIPSYRLIAKGNIYIFGDFDLVDSDSGVTQLDGFYSAGGNIYTCSWGSGYNPTTDSAYYYHCDEKLTVYGAFQALGSIKYWRTNGSLNKAVYNEAYTSPNLAESFISTPELLLGGQAGGSETQSIRSLPPIF